MKPHHRQGPRGFSLVELMVGLVIGLLAVVIVMQVFRLSEGMRRSTSGSGDAQTAGAVALSMLLFDLRQAGQGLATANTLGCSLSLPGGRSLSNLGPVVINSANVAAGDANTDTLLVAYGTGNGSPEGQRITGQTGSNTFNVPAPTAYSLNDRVIATPESRATPCALTLDRINAVPTSTLSLATGATGMTNGVLYNLGQAVHVAAYRVSGGQLATCNYMTQDCSSNAADNWATIAEGVISLRAQYTKDTSATMDAIVDTDGYNQTTPTAYCSGTDGWSRVLGLRLALVARSGQLEKDTVTAAAPDWAASAALPINLSGNTNWQRYRYKTFETTLPLRNMSWPGVVTGC
ncbi:MAG: prepilin-type N-terminal cleavage/methylation domain-containing protein [Comamonadaceae bacterium]|nr:prepilin-type N-terminal cleavage/methylation domain-containing protein [Comamonadaceae bacterium]